MGETSASKLSHRRNELLELLAGVAAPLSLHA